MINNEKMKMDFLTMIFTALTALFTGASVYLLWRKRIPIIEFFGEEISQNEYKCILTVRNITDSVAKIYEIKAYKPLYSTVCPMAGIRANPEKDIKDTRRYNSSFKRQIIVNPKSEKEVIFFFNNGTPSDKKLSVILSTSWSTLPIIKKTTVIANIFLK